MIRTIICEGDFVPVSAAGKIIYTAPELAAQIQSRFSDHEGIIVADLLRELPDKPDLLWKLGFKHSEESVKAVKNRTSAVSKLLLSESRPCIVYCPNNILPFLLRAMEKQRCFVRRSKSGPIQPGERIRVTERADHCGGCQHNCLLSNPGCGVGKDKARQYN